MKLFLTFLLGLAPFAWGEVRQHRKVIGTQVHEGIEVEFSVEPTGHGQALEIRNGKSLRFLFSIRDTTTGDPVTGLYPAAWVQHRPKGITHRPNPQKMIQTFISGGLFSQPDLDLNIYHVLALNDNNTISVVDPLFGFGGSKLLAMISLPGPGKDWAKMTRASKLFVSLPESNQIALIDTSSWQVSTLMPQVNRPTRLALQPDEHFLWASLPDGVAAFKTAPFSLQYMFPTGKGEHQFAFSADNRFAYITNSAEATLTVIDLSTFKISRKIPIDPDPTSLVYDPRAESVYITHSQSGTITCLDAEEHTVYKTVSSEPGLGQLRFAPRGRWGFLVNPQSNRLSIFDSSLDRIVQSGIVGEGPYEVSFSDNFAYIRHLKTPGVLLVPLDGKSLGQEGSPIPTIEAPAGDSAYGLISRPTPAPSIVQAPGANAVLIANPADKAIYFYKEGMAAPMGQFNNYGQQPRAVLVVDRSLREKSRPGVYETVGKLEKSGIADLAFFTDCPRMTFGFELDIQEARHARESPAKQRTPTLLPVTRPITSGTPTTLTFQVSPGHDPSTATLEAHTFLTAGTWQSRQNITMSKDGTATLTLTPPLPGFYQVILTSRTSDLTFKQKERLIFRALPKSKPTKHGP